MSLNDFDVNKIERDVKYCWSNYYADDVPELRRLFAAVQAAQQVGVTQGEQVPTMNVVRTQLVAQLVARRDEIAAVYSAAEVELAKEDATRGEFPAKMAAYYTAFAEGMTSGQYVVSESGSLRQKPEGPEVPKTPSRSRSESDINFARTQILAAKAAAVAPFNAQIQMLEIGADEAITVNGVQVSTLLNTPIPTDVRA